MMQFSTRIKLIFLAGAVGVIIIALVLLRFLQAGSTTGQSASAPTPALFANDFRVVSITPAQQISTSLLPIQQITIRFNDELTLRSFVYHIDSPADVLLSLGKDRKTITISPKTVWPEGMLTLTILPQTQSEQGNRLNRESVYEIRTALPPLREPLTDSHTTGASGIAIPQSFLQE